jgi:hypothetical protein
VDPGPGVYNIGEKRMTPGATGKKHKGRIITALYAFMALNIIVFIILMFFTRTFWKEVNAFMQDATGIPWDWVTIIITVSVLLVIFYVTKTILCIKKILAAGDAPAGTMQIVLMLPVFLAWNALGITLVQEAADARSLRPSPTTTQVCSSPLSLCCCSVQLSIGEK